MKNSKSLTYILNLVGDNATRTWIYQTTKDKNNRISDNGTVIYDHDYVDHRIGGAFTVSTKVIQDLIGYKIRFVTTDIDGTQTVHGCRATGKALKAAIQFSIHFRKIQTSGIRYGLRAINK